MKDSMSGEYTTLPFADDDVLLMSKPSMPRRPNRFLHVASSKWTLLANLVLLMATVVLLPFNLLQVELTTSRKNQADISWSPITDKIKSKTMRFNETFRFPTKYPSKFAGPPSPVVDAEWAKFTMHEMLDGRRGTLAVALDVVGELAKQYDQPWLESTIKLSHNGQDRYMAALEMCHHVHCLDMLRKASYFEYYPDHDPRKIHGHLDHCIESLREVLMCNSGTGIAMFHWIEGIDAPYPDYNTYHQCRDPYEVLEWALDQAVPVKSPIKRNPHEFAMPGPPY